MDNLETIDYRLNHLFVDDQKLRGHIAFVLSKMTDDIIEFVEANVIFVIADENEYGRCINVIDLEKQYNRKVNYIIFLNSEFLTQTDNNKFHTIAHEIGHAYLGHENEGNKLNHEKMEKEANKFARKFDFKKYKKIELYGRDKQTYKK